MTNAWGTPAQHREDIARQAAFERGTASPPPEKTEEAKTEAPTVEVPTVLLPDGTSVPVDQYDPYAQQRKELETKDIVNQVLTTISSGLQPAQKEEEPKEEEPIVPPFEPITFSEEDMVDETTQVLAQHVNTFAGMTNEQLADVKRGQQEVLGAVDKLVTSLNTRKLEDDIEKVAERTGFTRDELIAGNAETNIDDPEAVATYLIGKKAMEEEAKEKAKEADEQRKAQMTGVRGTTGNAEGGGTVVQIPGQGQYTVHEKPKDLDYTDVNEIVKHFDFRPTQ